VRRTPPGTGSRPCAWTPACGDGGIAAAKEGGDARHQGHAGARGPHPPGTAAAEEGGATWHQVRARERGPHPQWPVGWARVAYGPSGSFAACTIAIQRCPMLGLK
jgi:hypothetical protein